MANAYIVFPGGKMDGNGLAKTGTSQIHRSILHDIPNHEVPISERWGILRKSKPFSFLYMDTPQPIGRGNIMATKRQFSPFRSNRYALPS